MDSQTGGSVSKGVTLFVTSLAAFSVPFMVSAVNVALPTISRDLSLDVVVLGWVPIAFMLSSAVCMVPFGRIGDIYGRRKVFIYGAILFTIACLLLPFSKSAAMLIIFQSLVGIGSSAMYSTSMAILISAYPPGERGKVLGINAASVYVGVSGGPLIGGFLTEYLTWRSIFFISAMVGLIVIPLVLWKIKREWVEARGEKMDYAGALIYGVGLIVLIIGLSNMPAFSSMWLAAGGVAALATFVWWELRVSSPVLNINIFRGNRIFAWSSLAALINYSATSAVGFLLSLYLQYIKGFSTEYAGLILIAQPVVQVALSPLAGRLSDRLQPQVVASIGMATTTVGLVLLTVLNEDTALWYIVMSLLILGLGFSLFVSPNTNAAMGAVEKKFYGVASGIVGTMRSIGQLLSLAAAVMLFALFIGHVQITAPYYPLFLKSARVAFIIFAALCFGGIFASLARGQIKR